MYGSFKRAISSIHLRKHLQTLHCKSSHLVSAPQIKNRSSGTFLILKCKINYRPICNPIPRVCTLCPWDNLLKVRHNIWSLHLRLSSKNEKNGKKCIHYFRRPHISVPATLAAFPCTGILSSQSRVRFACTYS